jgi:hypothetical protein
MRNLDVAAYNRHISCDAVALLIETCEISIPYSSIRPTHHYREHLLDIDQNSNKPSRASIYCNGLEISIGKNLHDAIRKIRSPGNSKMIGADAICS